MDPEDGWKEWSNYVLKELERLDECYQRLDTKVGQVLEEIARLKVKSGVWGALGGLIPVIIVIALYVLRIKD